MSRLYLRAKIADFCRRNALRPGLRNLWHWFPAIWQDRGWDYAFIYTILRVKLTFQEETLRRNDFYEGVEQDCRIIRECIGLLDQLIDDPDDSLPQRSQLFDLLRDNIERWWD